MNTKQFAETVRRDLESLRRESGVEWPYIVQRCGQAVRSIFYNPVSYFNAEVGELLCRYDSGRDLVEIVMAIDDDTEPVEPPQVGNRMPRDDADRAEDESARRRAQKIRALSEIIETQVSVPVEGTRGQAAEAEG